MPTARTCTTPEEGWGLIGHFLRNRLQKIGLTKEVIDAKNKEKEDTHREERMIEDTWSILIGNIYMVMQSMSNHGHSGDYFKMEELLELINEADITNPETHESIMEKYKKLNSNAK